MRRWHTFPRRTKPGFGPRAGLLPGMIERDAATWPRPARPGPRKSLPRSRDARSGDASVRPKRASARPRGARARRRNRSAGRGRTGPLAPDAGGQRCGCRGGAPPPRSVHGWRAAVARSPRRSNWFPLRLQVQDFPVLRHRDRKPRLWAKRKFKQLRLRFVYWRFLDGQGWIGTAG